MYSLVPVFACIAYVALAVYALSPVRVQSGLIEGGRCDNASGGEFFKGIPFAQPPTRGLRFASPVPATHKYAGGKLLAKSQPPACIQFSSDFAVSGPTSEDCLYLNVFVPPSVSPTSKLPVRVWVYGGSNTAGGVSDPLYDGCDATSSGTIIVTLNYRLGALGFLFLPGTKIQGNQGIQDIILALRWVHRNIASFGGDPDRVLLNGQSAGAYNAFAVATLPQAPDLFAAAIFESGGGRDYPGKDIAHRVGSAYAAALNCSIEHVDCIRALPVETLQSAYTSLPILRTGFGHYPGLGADSAYTATMGPFIDGHVIPRQPSQVGVAVPSIFGFNTNDAALFVLDTFRSPLLVTSANYSGFLRQNYGEAAALRLQAAFPLTSFNRSQFPAYSAMEEIYTLSQYKCPALRGASKAYAQKIPSWIYAFNHTLTCPWIPGIPVPALPLFGPTHTAELPFVFGHTTQLPLPNGTCSLTNAEKNLSSLVQEIWTNTASEQSPQRTVPDWYPFERASCRGVVLDVGAVTENVDCGPCIVFDDLSVAYDATC